LEKKRFLDCDDHGSQAFNFSFNESGRADLVVVLNFPKRVFWAVAPRSHVIKVLQEPLIRSFWTHRFTYAHSNLFHRVLSHAGPFDGRVIASHGHFPLHVNQLHTFPEKSKSVSVIASTLTILPGHKRRHEAVSDLLAAQPELIDHSYGRGRREISKKEEALESYRYSIAIENESSENYFTEKIMDCFAMGVVPIYFGAPNIEDFFPSRSFIKLSDLSLGSLQAALRIVENDDYSKRIDELKLAASLTRKYSRLCCLASEQLKDLEAESKGRKLMAIVTIDTLLTWVWRTAFAVVDRLGLLTTLKRLKLNLLNRSRK
jgi:hypothetical protein